MPGPLLPTPVRLVVLLLAVLLLTILGSVGSPRPAYAVDEPVPVDVRLEGLDPAMPARSDTVTLRGTARNTSDRPIAAAQVVLWRHGAGMVDLLDLREVTGQDPHRVQGTQLWIDGAYQRLTTDEADTWAPGETRPFQVSAPVDSFGFARASGAFLIGVQVVGRIDGGLTTVGQARVLLPLGPTDAAATGGTNTIASAVLLSSQPSMTEPGVFVDDHLAAEVAPDGRLSTLIRSAERNRVSWLVDPSLLDELSVMAESYVVRTPDGDRPGTGQEAAAAWLGAYARLDQARGYRLPYAIPDVTMLERAQLRGVVQRSVIASQRTPGVAELPLISYAAGGVMGDEAVALAEADDPAAILASTADVPGALLAPVMTAPIINFSPATTAGGPGPDPSHSTIQTRQRMLAESFLTAHTESGATTVRVVTSGEAAEADEAAEAPWLRRTTIAELLGQRPLSWNGSLSYGDAQRAAELTEPQVDALRAIVQAYRSFTEMLVDEEATSRTTDAAMARTASSWWRSDRPGFDRFATPQSAAAQRLWSGQAVELTGQRSVIMSGQSGSFPMTVTNHLDQSIRVTLTFESFQPQRLAIPPMRDIIVPANQGVTVNVQPNAVGNGPVRISAQVTTPGGTPVSKRVWMTVEATNFGRVGWIIVIASGIVLVATTALRIRQVRRERQAARRAEPGMQGVSPIVTISRPSSTRPDQNRTPGGSDKGEKR